jgi:hypothetical protein
MSHVQNRRGFNRLGVVALVTVLGTASRSAATPPQLPPAPEQQRMLLGPFSLANLFQGVKETFEDVEKGGGPPAAKLPEAMKGCNLWVVDRKEFDTQAKKWRFNGYGRKDAPIPKLLLEGDLLFLLKDAQGKEFRFQIERVDLADGDTDTGHSKVSQRWIRINVKFATSSFRLPSGGKEAMAKDISVTSRRLYWDVSGKTWLEELDKVQKK